MAQYTVIQDIEAEDKLLGPLSLRQFIYAGIVIVLGFIAFQLGRAVWFLALPFLPPMIFFGLLAAPFGQNQSSEIWLLAKIRYFLFPRRRIWDQAGIQDLVRITVPKKVETTFSKGFSQEEVTSRLKALANTLDTRGWAVKNVTTSTFQTAFGQQAANDRLIDIAPLPDEAEAAVRPSADVLDVTANPVAGELSDQLDQSSQAHRQALLDRVHKLAAQQQSQNSPVTTVRPLSAPQSQLPPAPVVHPQAQADNKPLTAPQAIINNAGDVIHQPKAASTPAPQPKEKTLSTMTTPANTDILKDVPAAASTSVNVSHDDTNDEAANEVVVSLR